MFFKKPTPEKLVRFRRPEFQEKLVRARRFARKSEPVPESLGPRFLKAIGLGKTWVRLLLAAILLTALYFLLVSKVFLVTDALILSGGPPQDELQNALSKLSRQRVYLVPKNHLLIFNKTRALAALQADFPEIRSIESFQRIFPNKAILAITERRPQYIWKTGQDYFYLDQDGVAFQNIASFNAASQTEPVISDETASKVSLGLPFKARALFGFADNLRRVWPQQIFSTGFSEFSLAGVASTELKVKTTAGFVVYFDLGRDAEIQIKNLAYLLNSGIKPETIGGLSYIDLRLPNVGYYCFKDAPCALPLTPPSPDEGRE